MAPRMGPGTYLDPGTDFFTKNDLEHACAVQMTSKKPVLAMEREARFWVWKLSSMQANMSQKSPQLPTAVHGPPTYVSIYLFINLAL